jgi:hypothetical protein
MIRRLYLLIPVFFISIMSCKSGFISYKVKFYSTLKVENASFTRVLGATHNEKLKLWSLGSTPSKGMLNLFKTTKINEYVDEIEKQEIASLIAEGRLGHTPGDFAFKVYINKENPMLTFVKGITPYKAKFVGVSSLDMRKGADLLSSKTIEAVVYEISEDNKIIKTNEVVGRFIIEKYF